MPIQFKPLTNRALRDAIATAIRKAIAAGQLRPGDAVPEAQIAEQMQVSRSPVREAFRKLEEQGLLVTYPHRGTYVASFTREDAREIYELRAGLESLAVRWAMQNGQAEALIEDLERILGRLRMIVGTDRVTEMAEVDAEFHEALIMASQNDRLYQVWRSIDPFVWMLVSLTHPERGDVPMRLIPEHEDIIEAIASGDTVRAETAVMAHIAGSRERLLVDLTDDLLSQPGSFEAREVV